MVVGHRFQLFMRLLNNHNYDESMKCLLNKTSPKNSDFNFRIAFFRNILVSYRAYFAHAGTSINSTCWGYKI
jgi:hypothetical protein